MDELEFKKFFGKRIKELRLKNGLTQEQLAEMIEVGERFPEDFMFQLTKEEWEFLRCQNGTSNENEEKRGGRKYLPYVFTEQGISMLSSVLHSKEAIAVNVQIMRIFVQLRQYALAQTSNVEELKKMLLLHIENTDNKFKN